jgi:hypothetical protein
VGERARVGNAGRPASERAWEPRLRAGADSCGGGAASCGAGAVDAVDVELGDDGGDDASEGDDGGCGAGRTWVSFLQERGFFPFHIYFVASNEDRREDCGIVAGRTMSPRYNIASKKCPLFSLFSCGRINAMDGIRRRRPSSTHATGRGTHGRVLADQCTTLHRGGQTHT